MLVNIGHTGAFEWYGSRSVGSFSGPSVLLTLHIYEVLKALVKVSDLQKDAFRVKIPRSHGIGSLFRE